MNTKSDNQIFKASLATIYHSKYMSIIVGVLCILLTVIVFFITRSNGIKQLEDELDSVTELYINRINSRIVNIEFDAQALADDEYPTTPQKIADWEQKAIFYINNLSGVEHIILADQTLEIQNIAPIDSVKYSVNDNIDLEQTNNNYSNIVLPVYDKSNLTGFMIFEVNLLDMMLDIDDEWKEDYDLHVYSIDNPTGSCSSYDYITDFSSCGSVSFQNNYFNLVITPTNSKVITSTIASRLIIVLGLSMSLFITYIWYSRSVTSDRLEHLVFLKTEELRHLSFHDQLTGLYNRRYYEKKIQEFQSVESNPFSIILADINGLKLVNDAFGHQEGDQLIKSATTLMEEHIPQNGIICRIGGDEFSILLPETTQQDAENIMLNIEEYSSTVKKENVQLSISFGVATRTDDSDLRELFRLAEDRMYQSKLIEVPSMRSNAIDTIMQTLNEKDIYSEQHVRNVAILSQRLATCMELPRSDIKEIHTAALLHDIGKIIIPSNILNKQGKLDETEYAVMKSHPEIGFRILNSTAELRSVSKVVLHHHERYDGNGYPQQLSGEEIPLKARIIAVVDAFDAMTTFRTYQSTRTKEEALSELIRCSGTQFDIGIVNVFRANFSEITADLDKK